MKRCYKCKNFKKISEFYRNSTRKDGRMAACKDCERFINREKRIRNKNSFIQKDKRYYQKNREKIIKKRLKWYHDNKEKILAHEAIKRALYNGAIKRPERCKNNKIDCTQEIIAHHPDYSKPLEVDWICHKCHMILHHGK